MGVISLLWGVLALLWMILALIPLLGWGNWFLIPFAAVGAVIAALGILFTHPSKRGRAWAGLVLNGIVVVVGILRLAWAAAWSEPGPGCDRASQAHGRWPGRGVQ
jgi:hypothetical protein